jgi:hypothetical protein
MFQTKETMTESRNDRNTVTRSYSYTDGWYEYQIPSGSFHDESKRNNNPNKAWPYYSKKFEAA